MAKLRHLLFTFLLTAILTTCALAQSNLTQIRDTISNPDGTPFNGTVVITWVGYSTATSGSVSPLSTSARIYNGALSVLLVPSTTAAAGSYYQVTYYSSTGTVSWSETWSVPPSTNALSVSGVRTSTTSGSSSSGGTSSGGSGSSGSGSTGSNQYATLPISMSDVTGLSTDLSTISSSTAAIQSSLTSLSSTVATNSGNVGTLTTQVNGLSTTVTANSSSLGTLNTQLTNLTGTVATNSSSISTLNTAVSGLTANVATNKSGIATLNTQLTNLTSTVTGLQSSGSGTLSTAFVDGETPSGTANGSNTGFTLSQTPNPAISLELYRNGIAQTKGVDYTLSGAAITFLAGNIPASGDVLQAYYRVTGSTPAPAFADGEVPSGTVNGSNLTFTLAYAPNPALSLKIYKNGVLMQQHGDYTLSGTTATFVSASAPQTGDTLVAYYRH